MPEVNLKLLVLESPNKAKKIRQFLEEIEPNTWEVAVTLGHWRELPDMDGQAFQDVVDPKTWEESFVVQNKDVERQLAKAIRRANTVYLGADADREGEAIAWHLVDHFRLVGAHRVEFREITKDAIRTAIRNPRPLDRPLVEAQRARSVLDYLIGMEISRRLWRFRAKSAGRVQSCVLRLLVEREHAIRNFVAAPFWTVAADYAEEFSADVFEEQADGAHDPQEAALKKRRFTSEADAQKTAEQGRAGDHVVRFLESKEVPRKPPPPFTTGALLAAAARLGLGPNATTAAAQSLYEAGHITYIRTDSVALAPEAVEEILSYIGAKHPDLVPEDPQTHKDKAGAQHGHEAIRPTSITASVKLEGVEAKLYNLIWERAVASQAASARYARTTVTIEVQGQPLKLRTAVSIRAFDGWERLTPDEPKNASQGQPVLSGLKEGQKLNLKGLAVKAGATKVPSRYTIESFVKYIEKEGIGRPSTYSSLMETLVSRGYCAIEGKHLVPQELGFVSEQLVRLAFDAISQKKFTAVTERSLDKIAAGRLDRAAFLREFYKGFLRLLEQSDVIFQQYAAEHPEYDRDARIAHDAPCPECAGPMIRLVGKHGPFAKCEAEGCSKVLNLKPPKILKRAKCPDCSAGVIEQPYRKDGKRKTFFRCEQGCGWKSARKPKAAKACPN